MSGSRWIRCDGQATVLVLDRDTSTLDTIGSVLTRQGYRTTLSAEENAALSAIASGEFDAVVWSIDNSQSGWQCAEQLRSLQSAPELPIIFLVPEMSTEWRSRLADYGGVFSMLQPIEPDELLDLIDKVLWMPHVARSRLGTGGSHLKTQADWVSLDAPHGPQRPNTLPKRLDLPAR